jgi:hypothetical protein
MNQTDYVAQERLVCQIVFHEEDTCAKHACLETDEHVPKTMRHTSSGWETLVTNIYGHETEAHVPKPICCKR